MNGMSVSTSLFNIESHVVTFNELFMSILSSYRCGSKAYKRVGRSAAHVVGKKVKFSHNRPRWPQGFREG